MTRVTVALQLWLALSATTSTAVFAQTLYMPRPVKKAFTNGTRSADGRPGPRYWQNHARYSISLTAAPPDRTIKGSEQITYLNNSPDTLRGLVMKFFLNVHKPGAPRANGASDDYLTSGVQVDRFAVNGKSAAWGERPFFTVRGVPLPAPLAPHDSVQLSFDWHYEISRRANREGMFDSTTYYFAYFYPRIAVYDDYSGWDASDFDDRLEFYSDFNDYNVSINVPPNYLVWGTGTLMNPGEVLQPAYLQRYTTSLKSDETIHIATSAELAGGNVTANKATNTWRFQAANVPDVTFAISNHYNWDGSSVVVDDAARRRASVQAAFDDPATDFRFMTGFERDALSWFSHNWPGVPYPYEKMTVVRGGAFMEYPMMVNNGSEPKDTADARFGADHEIAHTYFPFYMGINETRYAFMDEGWATALEYLILVKERGQSRADSAFKSFRVRRWANSPSIVADIPIVTPDATGDVSYGRPALAYLALKSLLGDEMFGKALRGFMDRWHGKHPIPWDFFNTFNDVTKSDLNWFWNKWFFESNYVDFALAGVAKNRSGYSVIIDNIGGLPAPIDLVVTHSDGTTRVSHQTPQIWKENPKRATLIISPGKSIRSVEINSGIWMDADTTNNRWTNNQ